ncbi:MAG: hypothetical protein JSU93_02635 [Methanobacteriota archaeon]|nr:MAG: hypothetical protein JSU93_02635 [Euryarchaeota archaeon]
MFRSRYEGREAVVKAFTNDAAGTALKEYSVLKTCRAKKVAAPIPIGLKEAVIVMEYVEGPTLAEFLDAAWSISGDHADGHHQVQDVAESLGAWLADFHGAFDYTLSRGDASIRNFIISRKGIVGIDFEESGEYDIIDDIGEACASVLSMRPMFSHESEEFCRCMVEGYASKAGPARIARLNEAAARALERYAEFRSDGDEMVRKAIEIRKSGLFSGEE